MRPTNLKELKESGWESRNVKEELQANFTAVLKSGAPLFPGVVGYENTVIPEISLAVLAGHDMLFLGEKGQAKSRLMRRLADFLDEAIPYLDLPKYRSAKIPIIQLQVRPNNFSPPTTIRMSLSHGGIAMIVTRRGWHLEQNLPM